MAELFRAFDLLLPKAEYLENWPVIACDQFTSDPEYWARVRERTRGVPSAYHMIFPEAELGGDEDARIRAINAAMEKCLASGALECHPDSFVYVERALKNGMIRRGVVGALDLDAYDYRPDADAPVRATEKTVVERIPPRVKIRRDAPIELSHVLLLMDDETDGVLSPLTAGRDALEKLYELELMEGGGHIAGWLVRGEAAEALAERLRAYEARCQARYAGENRAPVLYAVGDGNHSLAAAKACHEQWKAAHPEADAAAHPSRRAMVELENIRDEAQRFEPIHRIVTGVDADGLLTALGGLCREGGRPVEWISGGRRGTLSLDRALGELPVGILQPFLDDYLRSHGGRIDYIHGEEALARLAQAGDAVGFLLPAIAKEALFPGIAADGVLPRKTFSMGHAEEKRYYLEARRIR